ncbi:unnamed protein product, partial [Musa acuminata var. zebrina]
MAISLRLLLPLLLLLHLLHFSASSSSGVHDVLKDHGLPKGLIPHSARDYSLADDGQFVVHLKAPCYVQFSDLVYYDQTITGKLSYGAITDLDGIQVKKLFVWFPVSAVKAHPESKTIEFKVGFLSQSFPLKEFKDVPDCEKKTTASCRGATGFSPEELLPVAAVQQPFPLSSASLV